MRIEFDRAMCAGWFQCVQEWDEFDMNMVAGKADLNESEHVGDNIYVREIPDGTASTDEVIAAAESCPVNAIKVLKNGEQLVPSP